MIYENVLSSVPDCFAYFLPIFAKFVNFAGSLQLRNLLSCFFQEWEIRLVSF